MIVVLVLIVLTAILLFLPFQIEFNSNLNFINIQFFYFLNYRFNTDFIFRLFNNINYTSLNKKKGFIKWRNTISSFKLKKLNVNIDTGDVQLNSYLFPTFFLIRFFFDRNININYSGYNFIQIIVQNNLARLSWAIFSSK
jgi:hypothetical protein